MPFNCACSSLIEIAMEEEGGGVVWEGSKIVIMLKNAK